MKKINWIRLISFIVVTEGVGFLSGVLSGNIGAIYNGFVKPPLSPPGWLFGIVWPILYALMGCAAYFVSESHKYKSRNNLRIYWVQLLFNFLWPIWFFKFGLLWASVIIIILLDVLVFLTMKQFADVDKKAGKLLLPYFIWIIFATYLNIGVAVLN